MIGPSGTCGNTVLDLYSGSGGFGIEALKRDAARVDFVEIDGKRCAAIKRRIEKLEFADRCTVYRSEVIRAIWKRLSGKFDVVFADPPYELNPFQQIFIALTESRLLANRATVFAEHSSHTYLADNLGGLRVSKRRRYGDTTISVYEAVTE